MDFQDPEILADALDDLRSFLEEDERLTQSGYEFQVFPEKNGEWGCNIYLPGGAEPIVFGVYEKAKDRADAEAEFRRFIKSFADQR